MDGLLPLDWALRNPCAAADETARLLMRVNGFRYANGWLLMRVNGFRYANGWLLMRVNGFR